VGGRDVDVREARPGRDAALSLLGGFELRCDGDVVALPLSAQRLIAFLALQERSLLRGYVAGRLWPDVPESRSGASLRSALWRLGRRGAAVVEAAGPSLRLAPDVTVDAIEVRRHARTMIAHGPVGEASTWESAALAGVLLPDWYEDWVVIEREQLRQLCLHGLERLAEHLLVDGHHAAAVDVALDAVRLEPLRESAHRLAARIHLAEGNRGEALRWFVAYRDLVAAELGVEPSGAFRQLVGAG